MSRVSIGRYRVAERIQVAESADLIYRYPSDQTSRRQPHAAQILDVEGRQPFRTGTMSGARRRAEGHERPQEVPACYKPSKRRVHAVYLESPSLLRLGKP